MAGLIWRVDLPNDGGTPVARVWLRHESMRNYPGRMKPEQPGINGIRYAAKLGYLYYTADLLPVFRTKRIVRDGSPEWRERCVRHGSRTSRLWRSCARPIAIRSRRWRSGTVSASRRFTLGASGLARSRWMTFGVSRHSRSRTRG